MNRTRSTALVAGLTFVWILTMTFIPALLPRTPGRQILPGRTPTLRTDLCADQLTNALGASVCRFPDVPAQPEAISVLYPEGLFPSPLGSTPLIDASISCTG